MNNMKGEITIEIRDAVTMEIKDTRTETNAVSLQMFYANMDQRNNNTKWEYGTNQTTRAIPRRIAVSGRKIQSGIKQFANYAAGFGDYPSGNEYPTTNYPIRAENSEVTAWNFIEDTPPYVERKGRFDSPATVQTINSIFLCGGVNFPYATATTIGLNTPCIQNPGEVLDITYRIQFYESSSLNTSDAYISDDLFRSAFVGTRLSGDTNNSQPYYLRVSYPQVPVASQYNEFDITMLGTSLLDDVNEDSRPQFAFDHFKQVWPSVLDKGDYNGQVISAVSVGGNNGGLYMQQTPLQEVGEIQLFSNAGIIVPLLPNDFAFKPIQPIQNHNKDAIEWGLDVDFLATSQGNITVNGDNWTNADWAEFWRVEFSKTGAVGTANYFFRNRRIIGFAGNSYQPYRLRNNTDLVNDPYDIRRVTHTRNHGAGSVESAKEYGADSYFTWDDTGINIHVINKPLKIAYDATTIPALNVTNVRDVVVDGNDAIWVACKDTGLYRITDPLNPAIATITLMSEATNGLFAGSEGNCHAVAIGNANSVFAVMEGSIVHTLNPGDAIPTFTNYNPSTPTVFDYSEVIADWSEVKYMRVDRNTATNELAIVFRVGNAERVCWWSTAGVSYLGPTSTANFFDAQYPHMDNWQTTCIDVSERGNLWVRLGPSFTSGTPERLAWSTIDNPPLVGGASGGTGFTRPIFLYDYYDTPYIGNTQNIYLTNSNTQRSGPAVVSVDAIAYNRLQGDDFNQVFNSSGWVSGMCWQNKRAGGLFIQPESAAYYTSQYRKQDAPFFIQHSPMDSHIDSLNGRYSPYEEFCWDRYHWNGSSWELNYYAPAIDSSTGTTYNADRHNFDTESHYFTGRSMIDATSAFDGGDFTSTATFAFNIQPNTKRDSSEDTNGYHVRRPKSQEREITLFDITDTTRQCKLMLKDYNSTPTIAFYEDGVATVLGTVLTDITSGFYRVVVVVNGTSVDVYVDGVQIGSTITLTSAYDWTLNASDMRAFIGCRAIKWDYARNHGIFQSEFFKGNMENVQFWNVAWNATDISNDFANINGVITSQPAANLIARYELTQSLEGLETKQTHAAAEIMEDGITVAFNDGASGDSFVATDYYTFGVAEGVLKDNSMSFSRKMSLYHKPVDHNFTEFANDSGTTIIEGVSTTQVIEPAIFKGNAQISNTTTDFFAGASLQCCDQYPGSVISGYYAAHRTDFLYQYMRGGYTHQPIVNDGYFDGMPPVEDAHMMVGLTTDTTFGQNSTSSGVYYQSNVPYMVAFHPNGTLDIYENGSIVAANVGTYTLSTRVRIRKTSTVVSYHIIESNVESLLHTSSIAATAPLYGTVAAMEGGSGVIDATISYTRVNNMIKVGNPNTLTGSYASNFLRVDTDDINSYNFQIDGIDALVISPLNETYENLPSPGIGEIVIDGKAGWLIFNDADIGKTLTGSVTVIYDEV